MQRRGNQLLAIVMGGGKTLTALAVIESMHDEGRVRSGLVLAGLSLQFQWYDMIRRETQATVQVINGSKAERAFQYKWMHRFRYNIISYQTLVNDLAMITHRRKPDFVIADEATAIKGFTSQRSRTVKALGKQINVRFALTGQPIENKPEELYSIMEFVDPAVLGPFPAFDRTFITRDVFGRPTRYKNMPLLQATIGDAMLRRSRDDIKEYLPAIVTKEEWVPLVGPAQRLYQYIAADALNLLEQMLSNGMATGWNILSAYGRAEDQGGNAMRGELMSRLLCMRLLCCHPKLLSMSADNFDDPEARSGSRYAAWLKENGHLRGLGTRADDTKLDECVRMVMESLSEDPKNKIVVYSFFKPMIAMLKARIEGKLRKPVAVITGDHTQLQRRQALARFSKHTPVLLSSDAGQYGVDLPYANYLMSYDLPWSAGAYAQRVARIDRTSSQFPHVTVMTLLTRGTIEERQFAMLRQKGMVAGAWLDGQNIDAKGGLTLSLESLRQFLIAA
jgi:SNF2 family DNA or RNA helicase